MNKVLKVLAYLASGLWLLSVCAIDSESNIPLFIMLACSSYLIFYRFFFFGFEESDWR